MAAGRADSDNAPNSYAAYLAVFIIIAIHLAIRMHLLEVPLERDEGEYAYGGWLLLNGGTPYIDFHSLKMPGIFVIYAIILKLFGETISAIHFGLAVASSISVFLVYKLGQRLYGQMVGLAAGAAFAVLNVSTPILGPFANAEHFVLPLALAGILVLLGSAGESETDREEEVPGPLGACRRFFIGGLLLGAAYIVKQHAALFVAFGGFCLLFIGAGALGEKTLSPARLKRLAYYAAGVVTPFIITVLWLGAAGALGDFWFWTFKYASDYVTISSFSSGLIELKAVSLKLFGANFMILGIALFGLVALFWDREARQGRFFLIAFFLFSFFAISIGFYYRHHYFILLLPVLALLSGVGLEAFARFSYKRSDIKGKVSPWLLGAMIVMMVFAALHSERALLFKATPYELSRSIYGPNPFAESVGVADYIRENTKPGEPLVVLGSEPQIYFYSKRRAVSGFLYMYPLMEPHDFALQMQERLIGEIERAEPGFIVFVKTPFSWMKKQESHTRIFDWFDIYKSNYELVEPIKWKWQGREKGDFEHATKNVLIFKRKNDA